MECSWYPPSITVVYTESRSYGDTTNSMHFNSLSSMPKPAWRQPGIGIMTSLESAQNLLRNFLPINIGINYLIHFERTNLPAG